MQCIAHAVYGEARGSKSAQEKYAVAWSIIFRAQANQGYLGGQDICDVVYKTSALSGGAVRWQYDGAKTRVSDMAAWEDSLEVAYYSLLGEGKPELPVMYFCAPGSCRWHDTDKNLQFVGSLGGHRFYIDLRFYVPGWDVIQASVPQS